jgi:hypothetical protein
MGRRTNHLARLLLALGLAAGLLGVLPGVGQAAEVGCGTPCDGKDPHTFVVGTPVPPPGSGVNISPCDTDAITLATKQMSSGGTVLLRFSPRCHTAWAYSNAIDFSIRVQSYRSDGSLRRTAESAVAQSVRYAIGR